MVCWWSWCPFAVPIRTGSFAILCLIEGHYRGSRSLAGIAGGLLAFSFHMKAQASSLFSERVCQRFIFCAETYIANDNGNLEMA